MDPNTPSQSSTPPENPAPVVVPQNTDNSQTNNSKIYPTLSIERIQNPNRFFAIPLLGGFIKSIILLPALIVFLIIAICVFFVTIINSFIVLFIGKYWNTAYSLNLGYMRYWSKIFFYWTGLTNKYPGFNLDTNGDFSVEMEKPQNPNRLFAIPLFGGLARFVILIPYLIYAGILTKGAGIGALFSSFPVLFVGRYPESTYEFGRDSMRVELAQSAYLLGFSDKYPSFYISMNHQAIKILLIILGVIVGPIHYSSTINEGNNLNYYRYNIRAITGMPQVNQNINLPGGIRINQSVH